MALDDLFPKPEPGLDSLVRSSLDADAESARPDAAAMWKRLQHRLDADAPTPRRRWLRRVATVAATVGIAAGILLAIVLTPTATREVVASPAEVVAAARQEHATGLDRRYRVTAELPPAARRFFPDAPSESNPRMLWTRGDRFVVEPGFGGKGAWGRDAEGRVWLAPTPDAAARFQESELSEKLANSVKLHGLELQSILDDVLGNFDLVYSEAPSRKGGYVITATRRGQPVPLRLSWAELVIDHDSKAIRSLAVRRPTLTGDTASAKFELQETQSRPDAIYTAEGHLNPGAPVYDQSQKILRRRLIARNLGEILGHGL